MDLRYYLSLFLRRLHWFVLVAGAIGGIAIGIALALPPAYLSQARVLIEASQIPTDLAAPTVRTPAVEQLQLFRARMLTRDTLLSVANQTNAIPNRQNLSPDTIVEQMRDMTTISIENPRNATPIMTLAFQSKNAQTAAAVTNAYLNIVLQEDSDNRTGRAGQTQSFFQQEVDRLSGELAQESAKILQFKSANSDALPESMDFRRSQQAALQDRLAQADREIALLTEQRLRMVQIFESTGRIEGMRDNRSPQEIELDNLKKQLSDALLVYSDSNPRVKVLQGRISQLEQAVLTARGQESGTTPSSLLEVQLGDIDARVSALNEQKKQGQAQLDKLTDSINRTPANAIALDGLERDYSNTQNQYNNAVSRLAVASTGERIEILSRGQRITVLEQPSVPSRPNKPERMKIAAMGLGAGIAAGLGLIVLLEFLNGTARRPSDIVKKLGVTPMVTIPYIQNAHESLRKRALRVGVVVGILAGIGLAIYGIHTLYLPLDLLAERIISKLSILG